MSPGYDKEPFIAIRGVTDQAWTGYEEIGRELISAVGATRTGKTVIVLECYPGVRQEEIEGGLREAFEPVMPTTVIRAEEAALSPRQVDRKTKRYMTDDRVFGYMAPFRIDEFYDADKIDELREKIRSAENGIVLVVGFGASLIARGDLLLYADLPRWEIQQRYRSGETGSWRSEHKERDPLRLFKRGFFFEWRMADRLKKRLLQGIDYYLDTAASNSPNMLTGHALFEGMKQASRRPFRLVPYFDPGVWGGRWLEKHIGLPRREHPYAWGFDGVPEENSLYFRYGTIRVELPAINLVFFESIALLGEKVYTRFGAEFPIRFDFLDTIGGQNLSLQVHPTTEYIRERFGMTYTQDESYYVLDAAPGAKVYLGLREGIVPGEMLDDLQKAQDGRAHFPAERYVEAYPASKHDHFLIPAGTVHCSSAGCMVLEISATPYIFTFKLWDWDRLGLDGSPRPVHTEHGANVIRWDRTTDTVREQCVNAVAAVAQGPGWKEERTGLHELQFIETRRHWFSEPVVHKQNGSVHMLNLVEGEEITVESPTNMFDPFVVRYAETFIMPASVSAYTIRPSGPSEGQTVATIKAYVRG